MKIPLPTFQYEQQLWRSGIRIVAGIDEVGRGAFAGPVVVAAVILPHDFSCDLPLHDSKLLSAHKREAVAGIIQQKALSFAIAEISVLWINKLGIGKATQMAFRKSIRLLHQEPDHVLIDAFLVKDYPKEKQTPIVHGDRLSISIAAASIIAKVYRDALMRDLHTKYSVYGFAENKGYGTRSHQEALRVHGLSPMHRTSFALDRFLTP